MGIIFASIMDDYAVINSAFFANFFRLRVDDREITYDAPNDEKEGGVCGWGAVGRITTVGEF